MKHIGVGHYDMPRLPDGAAGGYRRVPVIGKGLDVRL